MEAGSGAHFERSDSSECAWESLCSTRSSGNGCSKFCGVPALSCSSSSEELSNSIKDTCDGEFIIEGDFCNLLAGGACRCCWLVVEVVFQEVWAVPWVWVTEGGDGGVNSAADRASLSYSCVAAVGRWIALSVADTSITFGAAFSLSVVPAGSGLVLGGCEIGD
jgi:hypothetical protein